MARRLPVIALAAAAALASWACSSTSDAGRRGPSWRAPGGSRADSALQVNALQGVYRLDDLRADGCGRRRIVYTEVIEGRGDPSRWVERWTVDRCGKRVRYLVEFAPMPEGSTGFTVRFE